MAAGSNSSKATTTTISSKALQKIQQELLLMGNEIYNLNYVCPSLRRLSTIGFCVQFVQAMILLVICIDNWNTQATWYTNYPQLLPIFPQFQSTFRQLQIEQEYNNEQQQQESSTTTTIINMMFHPQPKFITTFPILLFAPIFIFTSSMEHLCCIVFKETYDYYIARNQNPFRWTEYSFSASLMKVLIGQLAGITDIHLLLCLFILSVITMQSGHTHETVNAKARSDGFTNQHWRAFFTSWLAHLTGWAIIFNYFAASTVMTNDNDNQNGRIWTAIFVLFFIDGAFAVLFTLQWALIPPFDDYVVGEKGFIILSFTAKAFLAWTTVFLYKNV